MSVCPHGREQEDCDFRGPCGDAAFLLPVLRAVAESNASVITGGSGASAQDQVADSAASPED